MFLEYLLSFSLYFATSLVVFALFLFLYPKVTPYDDYKMIFEQNNIASALGFGGAVLGLCIPLYSVLAHSVTYGDFAMWAGVAMAIQLTFAFVLTRLGGKFSLKQHIENGDVAAGAMMAFMSISIGLLNAGSMSY
jgi:putative membrane protein